MSIRLRKRYQEPAFWAAWVILSLFEQKSTNCQQTAIFSVIKCMETVRKIYYNSPIINHHLDYYFQEPLSK